MRRLLLALLLVSLGRALKVPLGAPTSTQPGAGTAALDVDALAETVAARLQADNRRTARARQWVVVPVSIGLAVAAVIFLPDRPAAPVTVRAVGGDATEYVRLIGLAEKEPVSIEAELHTLYFTSEPANREPLRARDTFRLALPVTDDTCARVAEQVAGTCGPSSAPMANPPESSNLRFSGPVLVDITAQEGRGLRIQHASRSSATFVMDAKTTVLKVDCTAAATVSVTRAGNTTDDLPLACIGNASSAVWMTILLPEDTLPVVGLSGLSTLTARATGGRAEQSVHDGVLQVDDKDQLLRSKRGRAVTVRAESAGGTELTVQGGQDAALMSTEVEARNSVSVLDEKEERLPTQFERHSDVWWALFGVVVSLLVTVGVDAVIRSR